MDVRIDHAVPVAGDDRGRRGDRAVARRQRRHMRREVDDVLGVRLEMARPQHQGKARPADVVGRRRIGIEDGADAGAHGGETGGKDDQAAKQRPESPRRGERVIPGHAARPGMAGRRDQHQAAHEFGRVQRHGEAERAGQRMNDHDRLGDAPARQGVAQRPRLEFGRSGGARARAGAPAVPRAVDAEHPKPERGDAIGERDAHVGEIARGAVDEQNRAAFAALRGALDDMDRAGAGLDEFADRRKALFDPPRRNMGEQDEADDQGGRRRDRRDHDRPAGSSGAVTAPGRRGRPSPAPPLR